MKERSQRDDRKGGRLCEESRAKDRTGPPRTREPSTVKTKLPTKGGRKEGGVKEKESIQEVYLTAMVVPRTPVAPRNPDKSRKQGDEPPVVIICSLHNITLRVKKIHNHVYLAEIQVCIIIRPFPIVKILKETSFNFF